MGIESIIIHYGYIFILIGTFFEGETVLVLAGFLAHQGYLSFSLVVAAAFIGTYAGDQLYFYIGRGKGMDFLDRHPSWKQQSGRAVTLLQRYQIMVIIGFRFIYGIRTVTPFIIGASGVSPRRFMALNAVGGIAWALSIHSWGICSGIRQKS
jgi:membrane protein DedA with SNARE-associated domain